MLLERAAYRLLDPELSVLEVAVEAGYSSHEAFTRAFARAYGQTPSQWRTRPGRLALDAPSGVHFHPPAALTLPARRKVSSMDLLIKLVEHNHVQTEELLERAAALPAGVLDAPLPGGLAMMDASPTMRTELFHLVFEPAVWLAAVEGAPLPEFGNGIDEIRAQNATSGPEYVAMVRRLSEESRLDEAFVDAVCDPPEVFTYGGMIGHTLTFAAASRMRLIAALGEAGVEIDVMTSSPMRFVAD